MRSVIFDPDQAGNSVPQIIDEPAFEQVDSWEGQPMAGVEICDLETRGEIELQLVKIAAGGRFVMHTSPKLAFCHIVSGAGVLGLPGGSLPYRSPQTFVFHPGALHDWHDVTEDTLLSVAIMPDRP